LRPALEAGVRTLLGKKTNLFVLFSMAGLVSGTSDLVLEPGLSMGIEL
jgi:hypothetical protein